MEKKPCTINETGTRDIEPRDAPPQTQAQPIKPFTHEFDFEGDFEGLTGIDVDRDNNVIIADREYLKMYSLQGHYIRQCKLNGISWGLSCHKISRRIAVSLRKDGVQIVDNFTHGDNISVPGIAFCYGISFINEHIAVSGKGRICVLDFNGKYIHTLNTETSYNIYYLHHHQSKLYFTDATDKVYCIKEDGTNLPTFTVPEIQRSGAVISGYKGDLYVAGRDSHNFVRLSPSGDDMKVVLDTEDGVDLPSAVCFNTDYKKLFVFSDFKRVVKSFRCEY